MRMGIVTVTDKQIPDNLDERIRLIERAIENRCKSLHVKKQEQHIQISGAAGRLTKEEKVALRELGIPHSTYGARLYKEHDEYRNYVKHLIERRLITFPE
jgi:hypothetical protein